MQTIEVSFNKSLNIKQIMIQLNAIGRSNISTEKKLNSITIKVEKIGKEIGENEISFNLVPKNKSHNIELSTTDPEALYSVTVYGGRGVTVSSEAISIQGGINLGNISQSS
jgi:hypothetical protein